MVDVDLRPPRRKRSIRNRYIESPFPIPIQTITGKQSDNKRWYYYFGHLVDDHVIISRDGDIEFLYRLGFFGKGIFSRSKPQYNKFGNTFYEEAQKIFLGEDRGLSDDQKILKKESFSRLHGERFRLHQQWAEETRMPECHTTAASDELTDTPQYEDLYLYKDTVQEEYSTEGEDELREEKEDAKSSTKKLPQKRPRKLEDTLHCSNSAEDTVEDTASKIENSNISSDDSMTEDECSKLMRLEDPYGVKELLVLTLEEAFFLSFGLGCLVVTDQDHTPMTLSSMWKTFSKLKTNFIESYAVYHYYRSKGWVVRNGIMYGTDYVLYKDGLQFYHSSYAVVVNPGIGDDTEDGKLWSWSHITSLNRVVENVAKELILCFVVKPTDLKKEVHENPLVISKLGIQELLCRRWIPEKFREKQK